MQTKVFKTDINCGACEAEVKPFLDAEPSISSWSVNTDSDEKLLTVRGDSVNELRLRAAIEKAGYQLLGEASPTELNSANPSQSSRLTSTQWLKTYFPLLLILAYLVMLVTLSAFVAQNFGWMNLMANFMGGFFLIFSFFKFLNLKGFVDAYQTYDVVAARSRAYGYLYPFIELGLGIGYVSGVNPRAVNWITLVVMLLSSVGVIQSLRAKRTIQCACLGTVFKLPMTSVTVFEDLLMVVMAAMSLVLM